MNSSSSSSASTLAVNWGADMNHPHKNKLRGVVLDTEVTLTLTEFCSACGVEIDLVREMVAEGVIEARRPESGDWLFSGTSLVRAQRALRLVRDLHVNWPGAALALDLMEELEQHERQLRLLHNL